MRLFDDIHNGKTKGNAHLVLKGYRRLARIAGEEYSPQLTATHTLEPKSFSGSPNKYTESAVVRRVSAQQDLELISKAINGMSDMELSRLLIERYCRKQKRRDKEIYMDMGYSESEFYRVLGHALLEFAECYHNGELLVYKS